MKHHLLVLDGLRGVAAVSVVIFHLQYLTIGIIDHDSIWFRRAYLAVDFFFCLSGYVLAYAYDDRRGQMTVRDFFTARLIRLHPLVILGVALGLASYLLDPFNGTGTLPQWMQVQDAPLGRLIVATLGGLFMLPTPDLPNRMGSYFPLNGPAWSLMWEYVASIAFGLVLWRAKKIVLVIAIVLAGVGIAFSAHSVDHLWRGFAWGEMPDAFARTTFSFCAGLLLYRCGAALRTPLGFGSLSVLLVLAFIAPTAPLGCPNWIYEVLVVAVLFPLIVAMGAGAQTSNISGKLCSFSGRVSYPIYVLHFPAMAIFLSYYWTRGIDRDVLPWVMVAIVMGVIAVSYLALVLYDEPARRRLKQKVADAGRSHILAMQKSGAL